VKPLGSRVYRGDKWARLFGSRIPFGAVVDVTRYCPRRRVIVAYGGERMLTMLWCLKPERLDAQEEAK